MNEGFISFKKKILKEHLVKCLLLSFSLGLIIFGVLFLLWKLKIISLPIWTIIIIPVAILCICYGITYFLFKPTDKKIAKRLDQELKLNEKVQTMVDYKESNEFIACLQREDTENKLKAISLKALKFNLPIALIVLGVLGIASTTTAVSIPMKHEQNNVEPEKPFTLTELQIKRIEEIIETVKEAQINETLSKSYQDDLTSLIDKLKIITKQDTVNEEVIKTIETIKSEMNTINANKIIGKVLHSIENTFYDDSTLAKKKNTFVGNWMSKGENPKSLSITKTIVYIGSKSYALETELQNKKNKAGEVIKASIPGQTDDSIEITMNDGYITYNDENYYLVENYTKIHNLGKAIYNFDDSLTNYFSNIKEEYSDLGNGKGLYGINYLRSKVAADSNAIKNAIESTQLAENDYYKAFTAYTDSLNKIDDASDTDVLTTLEAALLELEQNITQVYKIDRNNRDIAYYIEDELRDIFGLEPANRQDDKIKDDTTDTDDSGNSGNKSDDSLSGGGYGEGETKYAHDDYFFHYDSATGEATFYAYGKFYVTYQGYFEALSNEGVLTDEMREFIESYFNKLNTGLDSEKNNKN